MAGFNSNRFLGLSFIVMKEGNQERLLEELATGMCLQAYYRKQEKETDSQLKEQHELKYSGQEVHEC